jgi:hypothetical protein
LIPRDARTLRKCGRCASFKGPSLSRCSLYYPYTLTLSAPGVTRPQVLYDGPFLARARSLTAEALDELSVAALTDHELAAAATAAAKVAAGEAAADSGTHGG